MRYLGVVLVLFGALILGACQPVVPAQQDVGSQTNSPAKEAIKIGVGFVPNVQFTPFYVGIEKGFYADEGLDVSLDYGYENDYLKLVGTNQMQFMVGSGDQVIIGRAQGLPVRYVMNWYTRYPVVLFAKRDAGITKPVDLKGKTIGIPGPYGATYVAYRGILQAGGLTEQDVKTESIGFSQAAAVSADKVDAAMDYGVNGPIILAQQGISTTQIALDEYLHVPSNGLVTNETTLQNRPDLVRKVVRATLKAVQYTLDHPDEAFEIALKTVPEAGGANRAVNRAVFDAVLAYWAPLPQLKPGETTLADWQSAAAFVHQIGLADSVPPAAELFTNEYLP